METFITVVERDPQIQVEIKDILDKYNKFSLIYHSKVGYENLIQKVILEELKHLMSIKILDIDIEIKVKISRLKYLESRLLWILISVRNGSWYNNKWSFIFLKRKCFQWLIRV